MPQDAREVVSKTIQQAIARAWSDAAYKQRLLTDSRDALKEFGATWPDHYPVEFYDNPTAAVGESSVVGKGREATIRVPIPAPPASGRLSTADLEAVVGAGDYCCGILQLGAPGTCFGGPTDAGR